MSTESSTSPLARSATDICTEIRLGKKAKSLLASNQTPGEFLGILTGRQLYADALRFMGATLPPREAVWWACLCVEHTFGTDRSAPEVAALVAAVEWVLEPNIENHKEADAAAREAGLDSAAGCAARAASLAGSAEAPEQTPVGANADYLARTVAGAVVLAAAAAPPKQIASAQLQFLALGLEVSKGEIPWTGD